MTKPNKEMRKHGIIFDCDGTLVNSLGRVIDSFNYALNAIGEERRTPAEIKRHFGASADRIFFQLLGDEKKALMAFERFLDHQTELAATTKLYEGIKDLLDLLTKEGVPLAVVTGRHSRDLDVVLKPHKITDKFIALIADNHVPKSKPAPDGLLLAAKKMGLPPSNIIYVGDSIIDVQAAHAARSISVAAAWDKQINLEEMAEAKPNFMAQAPHEVWTFFNSKFGLR